FEQGMRSNGDRDQDVAGAPTRARCALPFQADLLAVGKAGRNLHLDFAAGRQLHAFLRAVRCFRKRDRQRSRNVAAAAAAAALFAAFVLEKAGAGARAAKSSTRGAASPKRAFENIVKRAKAAEVATAASPHILRTPGETLETATSATKSAPS